MRLHLTILALAMMPAGCETAGSEPRGATIHWRFAIEEPVGSVQHAYAERFRELIEQRSDGAIRVTVYPYGTLGTSDQITELVDMNVVQFAMASPGHLGKLIPEVQVFLLHFLFSDDEQFNNQLLNDDPDLSRVFQELYAARNLQLLSIWSEGWQVWTTKTPVAAPSDFRGMKFRVMTSPLLLAAYNAYGASATPLPYSEVYSALQLNMIEGQENPVFAIQEMSFHEVTDYMIFPYHAPFITTTVTNREFFESLPPEQSRLIEEVADELNEYILQVQQTYNRERLQMIRDKRPDLTIVEGLSDEQRMQFRSASQPVYEQFVEIAGGRARDVLDLVQQKVAAHDFANAGDLPQP
ncbi:MAG: DctP family TRAP transporter solute-binding subunit [Planctomycetaceae bacterium]